MEPKAALSLTESQLSVLLDAIHDEFMSVSEAPGGAARTALLDTLSNLHARVELALQELDARRQA